MRHAFNPAQFIENGAAVLAERARQNRTSAHKRELFDRARARTRLSTKPPLDLAA